MHLSHELSICSSHATVEMSCLELNTIQRAALSLNDSHAFCCLCSELKYEGFKGQLLRAQMLTVTNRNSGAPNKNEITNANKCTHT